LQCLQGKLDELALRPRRRQAATSPPKAADRGAVDGGTAARMCLFLKHRSRERTC
jgi:hypothetical protein